MHTHHHGHAHAHDHGHDHDHPHDHSHAHDHGHHGHNSPPPGAVQWQTPHLPHDAHDHGHDPQVSDDRKDLDLVEQAFVEGFHASSDPTSFLRLANIPFTGRRSDGSVLRLLRVEQSRETDIGSITPVVGGGAFRYAPLPAKMASQRDRLNFLYLEGERVVKLSLDDARALLPEQDDPARTGQD